MRSLCVFSIPPALFQAHEDAMKITQVGLNFGSWYSRYLTDAGAIDEFDVNCGCETNEFLAQLCAGTSVLLDLFHTL